MTIIFLHSPRTGGTSMAEILGQVYGSPQKTEFWDRGVWLIDDSGLCELRNQSEFEGPCIHGHMPYGVHRHVSNGHAYLMMIRDPVERITSLYHYIMHLDGHGREWWIEQGVIPDMTLEQFCRLPMGHTNNSMARQIAGLPFRHEYVERFTKTSYAEMVRNIANIRIGLLNKFEDSIRMFREELQWPRVDICHHNGREHPPPTKQAREIIERRNRVDRFLFETYNMLY